MKVFEDRFFFKFLVRGNVLDDLFLKCSVVGKLMHIFTGRLGTYTCAVLIKGRSYIIKS